MREVLVELRGPVEYQRPVARVDRARGELPHPPQRPEVRREVTLGRIDHARSPAQHRVPGEQGGRIAEHEAHVVGRVSGRVHGGQRDAVGPHDLAVPQAPAVLGRAERVDRRPGPLGERRRPGGVIGVSVREDDRLHRARRPLHLIEVAGVVGAGIDHDRPAGAGPLRGEDVRVRPLEREDVGVRRQDADDPHTVRVARTASARSSPHVAAHRARSRTACRHSSSDW